ncbi:MAG TPA: hypothetical protein VIG04_10875 [Gemmatimonadales bacterium]
MRALVLCLALAGCSGENAAPPPEPAPGPSYRVLFIGNSLTYFNDLPGTVAQLASSVSQTIEVSSVARPNLALIDHVEGKSNALQVIQGATWDYVVLQQGPSSLDLSRDTLVLATRLLDPYVKAAGGRSALLMVWPESARFEFFDEVRASYQLAAQEVAGLFLPAGEAWLGAWALDPQLQLYGPDGYHPSELGTYLAALVVFEGITGHDARSLPGEAVVGGHAISLPESRVRLLQRAAHEAVVQFSGD